MQPSQRQRIKEITQRLADRTLSGESARQLHKLLEDLARDSDFESLPEISLLIREQLEAGTSEGRPSRPVAAPEPGSGSPAGSRTRNAIALKAIIAAGSSLVLLILVLLLSRWFSFPPGLWGISRLSGDQTPLAQEATAVAATPGIPTTQPVQPEVTPTPQPEPGETPLVRATSEENPLPTPSEQEYVIQACVKWQDDQEAGLPGSTLTWQTDLDVSNPEKIIISNEDGCAEFPVSVAPKTRITLRASPPGDDSNLWITDYDRSTDDQLGVWEVVEDEEALAIATTLGEKNTTEYTARFLVVAQRTFSGEVLSQTGTGIPGAEVHLWRRYSPKAEWEPIDKTTTTAPGGTFVLTDTIGSSQAFYRLGVDNMVTNRYVFTTTSASGPDAAWVGRQDPQTPSIAWLETQAALGFEQLNIPGITFNLELEYVLLSVPEAILEPEEPDWQPAPAPSGQAEPVSRLATIDRSNIDRLQVRWEDIELPPGVYALEIWTPGDSSARVTYQVLSSGQLLEERTSYQSTRQDRGEINQWIDFSKTLNPSLVIQSPASGQVSVIVKPSLSVANREYNLGGNIVFGIGPVRFVKQ